MITADSSGSAILALRKTVNSTALLEFSKAAFWISRVPPTEIPLSHREQNFLLDRRRHQQSKATHKPLRLAFLTGEMLKGLFHIGKREFFLI